MQVMKRVLAMTAGILVCACLAYGDDDSYSKVKLTIGGYASYSVGEVAQANPLTTASLLNENAIINHAMFQQTFAGFNLQGAYSPFPILTNLGLEMKAYTELPALSKPSQDQGTSSMLYYFPYLTRADFIYSQSKALNFDFGYFPIKYNENARNLGEYLFRTGTYPQYIITNFDFPAARVTGLNVYGTLFDNLNYKALLTINTQGATIGDLNLTGIASYSLLNKFLDIGGGISFCSFISGKRTHPSANANNLRDVYLDKNGDSASYTFAGTKLMGRFSIDPKVFLHSTMFGQEDLKIYAEAAVLGVKDYPVSVNADSQITITSNNNIYDTINIATHYNNILKRIPIMFGFNFPTFKFLDVLSLEAEWFGTVYPNDMTSYIVDGYPVPLSSKWAGIGYADSTKDNWKWSIYAKKTFAEHFNIVFQVACDHFRWDYSANYAMQSTLMSEALTEPNQFYWQLKFGYCF